MAERGLIARLRSWISGPVGPINWTSNGGIPVGWPANYWQKGLFPYQSGECATVNACVNAYAQTIAQLPGAHYRKGPDGGQIEITTSALSRILRTPNSYQTRSDFMLNLVCDLLFRGNAYAWAERSARQDVTALHPIPAIGTTVLIDRESRAIFYGLAENPLAGELDYAIPQRDVLHVRCRTRPGYPLAGITPLAWAALSQSTNTAISASQAAFFAQASQPSGFLSSDQPLSGDQMTMLREAWQNRTQGVSAGQVPILGGGLKFNQLTMTSQDSQLIEAFKMTVIDIARAFGVPLPIIGELENVKFNSIEQLISFWLSTGLGFLVEHIEVAFDKFFALPPGQFTEFDTDTLLRTAFADRIDGLTKAISGGLYSPNEARAREGLPNVEGGEEPRVQAQVVPLSQINAEPAPSAPTPEVPPSGDGATPATPATPSAPIAEPPPAKALETQITRLAEALEASEARHREAETRAAEAHNGERIELLAHLGDLEGLVAHQAEGAATRIAPLEATLAELAGTLEASEARRLEAETRTAETATTGRAALLDLVAGHQTATETLLARQAEETAQRFAPLEAALAELAADLRTRTAPLAEQQISLQGALEQGLALVTETTAERIAPLEEALVGLAGALAGLDARSEQLRTMIEASDPALDPDEAEELALLQLRKAKREARHAP
jgi:HK97 family phage portal protein